MHYLKMSDLNLLNKRVLIREDFNVPMENQHILDDTRIRAAIPTIQLALNKGAAVILVSHFGRPAAGMPDTENSLKPVATHLSTLLNTYVRFEKDWINGIDIQPGEIVLCENVRFLTGETRNDDQLSKRIAALCDVFVMDAFAAAHRAHASTTGVARFAKQACAGPLLDRELSNLSRLLSKSEHPVVAIVGGAKVSTKFQILKSLLSRVDVLIVGGGIANTCLLAKGLPIGKSLAEPAFLDHAKELLACARDKKVAMPLPVDVRVTQTFSAESVAVVKKCKDVQSDDLILDIGPDTEKIFMDLIAHAKTIIWNGPLGVFEFEAFAEGTKTIAKAIAQSDAFSVAGGGDTLSAVHRFNMEDKISYMSTGGGAFLEWLEGKTLPGVAALQTH